VELYRQALATVAGGVGHDLRHGHPLPVYIERASGAYKRDVDGRRFIDYGMGNAALLLGHAPPEVIAAIHAALDAGYHFGNDHPLQIEWARLIQSLVPSAERIRFVNSGSEGSMLALRLARAFTGRTKVLRFEGHFSGWHDGVGKGAMFPFDEPVSAGIPQSTLDTIVILPADLNRLEETLKSDSDIAAVMIEPSGASWGTVPLTVEFTRALRRITEEYGVLLIFDEVITGFRYAPGGYQAFSGVTPDMSILGKVVSGGMPGGAVVGRADIMRLFDYTGDARHDRYERVHHLGTFNANPLAAAAGIATLRQIATGQPQNRADHMARLLRQGMDAILIEEQAAAYVYGEVSIFHVYMEAYPGAGFSSLQDIIRTDARALKGIPRPLVVGFQEELRARCVDILSYTGGVTSAAHTEEDINRTLEIFQEVIRTLMKNHILAGLK
jgi:glutamate-1-semialdehyde 2,1-aminomutase